MVNRGHRVFAFAPEMTNKEFRILSHIGAEAYTLMPLTAAWDKYRRLRDLASIFRDIDPHVALIQSCHKSAVSLAAAKMARVPHVVTVVPSLGPSFMEGASPKAWANRQTMKGVYRTMFHLSDTVLFHSAHDRAYARRFKLISEEKPHLATGGWGEDLRRIVQRPLPPLDRGILFLMVAPLDYHEGILDYCEAAKLVRQKSRSARFFLATAEGEAVAPLPVAELKRYREHVQYIGPLEDPASVLAKCHVVVAPSHGNGIPQALRLALALGRPAITTDTRSCRDLVQHGLNGFRAPVRNPQALSRAMIQMLQRPDTIPLMAEESRRLALQFLDLDAVNTLVLEAMGL
jgi:glycosyltransferase involved in cell wall biosynthesis